MNHHFENEDVKKAIAIKALAKSALYSTKDDCVVVPLRCFTCNSTFHELHSTARANVILEIEPLCIKCDGIAERIQWGAGLSAMIQLVVSL